MCVCFFVQGKQLCCLALGFGNITAAINDGQADPLAKECSDDSSDVDANVALVAIAVGNWPFLFVVATKDIAAGDFFSLCLCHACMYVNLMFA